MNNNIYAGELELVLENKGGKTSPAKSISKGLVKISPNMRLNRESIPTYFLLGLGGGYVEGEKYRNRIELKDNTRSIITTQASTKVYKCLKGKVIEQNTELVLGENSVLEFLTDAVILYKDAIYKQVNNIILKKSSTLIYCDGITSGWSPEGAEFQYSSVQLSTKVYLDNKLVLLDNLLVDPREDDVTKLGFFEGYRNFGTLLVISDYISEEVIDKFRVMLDEANLPIYYGISKLEVSGFVLRVLGNLTQDIEAAIMVCHNYIRKEFLGSRELIIRKY